MHLGFALEYSLGHTTHAQNLKQVLGQNTNASNAVFVDLPYDGIQGAWTRLPGFRSNWSLRASMGAYLGLRSKAKTLDAALFHTQVTSLFSAGLMRRIPSVVSLDATPLQYDAMGAFYGHQPSGSAKIETLKKRLNQRAFTAARYLVTWSQWAKDSLVADYGVPADKITVIPPGIDVARWDFRAERLRQKRSRAGDGTVHLLFVGGDFPRKGGDTLLMAFRSLPAPVRAVVHLHIVTKTENIPFAERLENVTVYQGVKPNSPQLLALFAQADAFVFPSRGDCLPLAVLEALAAGLPVITTGVGALPEAVTHGESGLVVSVDDAASLAHAIGSVVTDPCLRDRLGAGAREAAQERFAATTNYSRLVRVVERAAAGSRNR